MSSFRPKQNLTPQEKRDCELQKEMYLLIKTVDVLEKYHTYEKIDDQIYEEQQNKNISKYQKMRQQIQGFNLDQFMEQYGMSNCTWAKNVLKTGLEKENQKSQVLIQLTQQFIKLQDIIKGSESQLLVKYILSEYEELITLIKKLDKTLQSLNAIERFYADYIKTKKFNDQLSYQETQDMLEHIEQGQAEFGKVYGIIH
ncbi:hypothetical protein PPERSA_01787 [Pseudocohnilembus persalinus]|uniref:Uncharacterized protein n=1 Tax=Pseudocohnilembus persalinus TaxID=266149 RepID=A0A0V0R1B0_PSEPJ|nr:hypothetical protein PPERSA_01787 [Pseudocohnilembus persalinus]|eukprot:KRX08326.1 hypothetical protein PPERSA_01787 [Pseudocohnilembus persalinus]